MRPTLTTLQDAISEYFDTCTARDTYEMADPWTAYCDDAARHSELDDWFCDHNDKGPKCMTFQIYNGIFHLSPV